MNQNLWRVRRQHGEGACWFFGVYLCVSPGSSSIAEVLFEAHSAPLGIAFYDKQQVPAEYRGDAFVAFHGSGPYDKPDGYKVIRVKFGNGKPDGSYEDFMTSFSEPGKTKPRVWGTPAGIVVAPDGSLLVADDKD